MQKYFIFISKAFLRNQVYRANTFLGIIANFVSILIQLAVWRALLSHGAIAGVSLSEMITYAILSTCISSILLIGLFRPVDERLKTGNIAVDLLKPLSYPLSLAADSIGTTACNGLFTLFPTLIISLLLFGLQPPTSLYNFIAFLIAVCISITLSFCLGYLIALLAFWYLTTMHFEWTLMAFTKVFAGTFLPLWFFPLWLKQIALFLPFVYLNYVPVALYLGRIPQKDIPVTLFFGFFWCIFLLTIAGLIWKKSMQRLIIQGG